MLAAAEPETVKGQELARAQRIPLGFLYDVLADLRRAELIYARRGSEGGYALARPAAQITLGDVIRVLDLPAATHPTPRTPAQDGLDLLLAQIWSTAQTATWQVLDEVTLATLLVHTNTQGVPAEQG